MGEEVFAARTAAFLRVFLPVRDWVARHGGVVLPWHVASEEIGLVNLHAVATERRYLGRPVPDLPEHLRQPLARYLDELPGYAPKPRPGTERFSRAAEQQFLATTELPRTRGADAP